MSGENKGKTTVPLSAEKHRETKKTVQDRRAKRRAKLAAVQTTESKPRKPYYAPERARQLGAIFNEAKGQFLAWAEEIVGEGADAHQRLSDDIIKVAIRLLKFYMGFELEWPQHNLDLEIVQKMQDCFAIAARAAGERELKGQLQPWHHQWQKKQLTVAAS